MAASSVELTASEWKAYLLMKEGYSRRQIAQMLECSLSAVDKHLCAVYDKVGAHNRIHCILCIGKLVKQNKLRVPVVVYPLG